VSVEVGYNRRWFHGVKVTDNTLRGPEDYQPFTILAPSDPRLPGGGGYPIALQMVTAAAANRGAQNYVTFETDFGSERTNYWHGVDFALNARLRQSLTFQVGTQTGRSVLNTCSADAVVDDSRVGGPLSTTTQTNIKDLRNCRSVDPFQTTLRGLVSYTVPKIDVLVSATLRSQPPVLRVATWQVPNTVIRDITGRLPPGGVAAGNTTIAIVDNDHRLYADNRRTQVDMRFAKTFRFNGRRADAGVDLYNLLNTNYGTAYENQYDFSAANGATWNNPTTILAPRFVRFNVTFNF